ncbi:uncharacterized protein [Eleutherodactylus coqui]|uniref:uncharacterized protein n=1 Tax=Eleutherodactylus coqui TaxID=57060 RepID=UPI0034624BAC
MRIPVTGATQSPRNQPDKTAIRRRRRRSVLTEEQTAELSSKFKHPTFRRCCHDGIDHYAQHSTCKNESNEELKRSKPKCYRVYEQCCNYTENEHGHKPVMMALRASPPPVTALLLLIELSEPKGPPPLILPTLISKPEQIPAIRPHEEEEVIVITVTQTTDRGRVTSTFTVKVDPTEDVSIQLRGKMFKTNIVVSSMTLPPADGLMTG